jgi:DNA-binding response OmpR family regulator
MTKTRILIVEDDPYLGLIMKECFEDQKFEARLCTNGREGLETYHVFKPEICILDVMMPLKDGFELARDIRHIDKDTPLIFLTAKSLKEDVIEGFSIGADDYVKKPFSMEELAMRVQAILKRSGIKSDEAATTVTYQLGKYFFDHTRQELSTEKLKKKLTHKEAELLKLLCDNLNRTLDRNLVLKKLWGDDTFFNARSMDVFIVKLRKLLKEDPNIEILNIRGKGFKLLLMERNLGPGGTV